MAKQVKALTAREVDTLKNPGAYADGGGLYLNIKPTGAKAWSFNFTSPVSFKRREMGLGSFQAVSLETARRLAGQARALVVDGKDPIDARIENEAAAAKPIPTFGEYAEDFISFRAKTFVGGDDGRHADQWRNSLKDHAAHLTDLPLPAITVHDIEIVLRPIWHDLPDTASKLQNRIETILDAAKAKSYRTGDNPARYKGHLEFIGYKKVSRALRQNHPSLPYALIPDLMIELQSRDTVAARALEFTILTASRTNESLAAHPSEFEFQSSVWICPAERMKGRKGARIEHKVPLSRRALQIARERIAENQTEKSPSPEGFLFPGERKRAMPMHRNAMIVLLADIAAAKGWPECTVHGMRASFKTWSAELLKENRFDSQVVEWCLAHEPGGEVENTYNHATAVEARAEVLDAWSTYCAGKSSGDSVIDLAAKRRVQRLANR